MHWPVRLDTSHAGDPPWLVQLIDGADGEGMKPAGHVAVHLWPMAVLLQDQVAFMSVAAGGRRPQTAQNDTRRHGKRYVRAASHVRFVSTQVVVLHGVNVPLSKCCTDTLCAAGVPQNPSAPLWQALGSNLSRSQ